MNESRVPHKHGNVDNVPMQIESSKQNMSPAKIPNCLVTPTRR